MNRQKNRRSFERLETRQMMAGNVSAAVVGTNLTITGDNLENYLTLHEIGATGRWEVVGLKTSINGNAPHFSTSGPIESITINLNGGNDRLTIQGGGISSLNINAGDGNDRTILANLQIGNLLFNGDSSDDPKGGNDSLTINSTNVSGQSTINLDGGNDSATVNNSQLGTLSIDGGAGNDSTNIKNSHVGKSLTLIGEDGNDATTLKNLTIGTFLHYEGDNGDENDGFPTSGGGNDRLVINNVQVTDSTFAFFSSIDMQDGNDTATINKFVDQDLQLTMGAGNDKLSMTNSTFLGGPFQRLVVNTGDGNDAATLKNDATGPLTVNVGTGENSMNVTQCTANTANLVGFGSLTGTGNAFANTPTVDPGFTHLAGQFNV
jgi:hypothetical protein